MGVVQAISDLRNIDSAQVGVWCVVVLRDSLVLRTLLVASEATSVAIVQRRVIIGTGRLRWSRWFRGVPTRRPLDNIDEARLNDLHVSSGQMGKRRKLHVTTICGCGMHENFVICLCR